MTREWCRGGVVSTVPTRYTRRGVFRLLIAVYTVGKGEKEGDSRRKGPTRTKYQVRSVKPFADVTVPRPSL